jgi:hypothetical protein
LAAAGAGLEEENWNSRAVTAYNESISESGVAPTQNPLDTLVFSC